MQDLTHATVANPGELPPDTVCDSGWFFEIYHPRIDYPDIQAIEVHVACTQPTLEDACEHVADLAGFLMSTHLMAGNVCRGSGGPRTARSRRPSGNPSGSSISDEAWSGRRSPRWTRASST